jgi:hypothetical protein
MIYKLGFNQNYYTFTLMLLIKIVLCSEFPWTRFINHKCFDMKFGWRRDYGAHPWTFPKN